MKRNNAFTGLEAAIVLIAFVVVAAIFSYVLLSAGFYASQRAQEVTYAGIKQVSSIMYPIGSVRAGITDDGLLNFAEFGVGVPEIGQPQDMTGLRILLSQSSGLPVNLGNTNAPVSPTEAQSGMNSWIFRTDKDWTYIDNGVPMLVPGQSGGVVSSPIVHPGDNVRIRILFGSTNVPKSGENFTLEIMPQFGPSFLLTKTVPQR